MGVDGRKAELRAAILTARSLVSPDGWAAEDTARNRLLATWLGQTSTVALYAARPGEPGTQQLIDLLAARGSRVLLPVLRRTPMWADFEGWAATRAGAYGIPEPTGAVLPATALAEADAVLVPCLAVGRDLTRLGTGGGWYDRALPHRRPGTPLVALTRAAEVIDTVPTLPHDVSVDGAVSERGWVGAPPSLTMGDGLPNR
ncbi:MAG: 5-formyltetrahydrofolate cyclo-ligase [Tessaracoccus sp.]|uniref:5-formyltetrahydrofolate cyclo-ligase n=1 Tax=Tessaracoccus sp. TaxID=1971211 RepID=UPI001EC53956|nr:5-formyltetrahydrofolate cyclo-ligase [Tessaracoccus sp.]MBK7819825.1 5-formyltetrahydrofolate cyclo-ligase [Tessaracoccus sp.]